MTVQERDFLWSALRSDQVAWADSRADWRQGNAERTDLAGHNNARNDHTGALRYHVVGFRGEFAGFLRLDQLHPLYWSFTADERATGNRIADYEHFIDAKTTARDAHGMPVDKNDPPHWAYLFILGNKHPKYCIVGWCWGHEAKQVPLSDPVGWNRPAHFITKDNPILKPVTELIAEIRRRRIEQAEKENHHVFYCHCGKVASFGFNVNLRADKLGTWYCREHRPTGESKHGREETENRTA